MNQRLKNPVMKSARALYNSFPVLAGVVFLVGLANTLIPKSAYAAVFSKNVILDSFIGGFIGSILAGNPITSYVLGGEMIAQGISMVAVIAFMVTWVTVGIVQLPAEAMLLGMRFALWRNLFCFLSSIAIAYLVAFTLKMIGLT